MKNVITQKIVELLSAEDLKIFEAAVQKKINESVALMEEEVKKKYDTLAEKYCAKKLEEETAKLKVKFDEDLANEKATLIESYDGQLANLEQKLVARLDAFHEHEVKSLISDETIEKIAINETYAPIVEKMRKVFAEHFIAIDTDGTAQLTEAQKTIKGLEKQLSEAIADKITLEEQQDKTASFLLISESTQGLKESQKKRVVNMFKDKKFAEVQAKIGSFVDLIKESKEVRHTCTKKPLIESVTSEDDNIPAAKPEVIEESNTFVDSANKYLEE
jgi:hypothetical protein